MEEGKTELSHEIFRFERIRNNLLNGMHERSYRNFCQNKDIESLLKRAKLAEKINEDNFNEEILDNIIDEFGINKERAKKDFKDGVEYLNRYLNEIIEQKIQSFVIRGWYPTRDLGGSLTLRYLIEYYKYYQACKLINFHVGMSFL